VSSIRKRLEGLEQALGEGGPKTYLDSPTGPELAALFGAIEGWEEEGAPDFGGYDEEVARKVLEETYSDKEGARDVWT